MPWYQRFGLAMPVIKLATQPSTCMEGWELIKIMSLWRYCLLAKECELINGSASQNIDRLGENINYKSVSYNCSASSGNALNKSATRP